MTLTMLTMLTMVTMLTMLTMLMILSLVKISSSGSICGPFAVESIGAYRTRSPVGSLMIFALALIEKIFTMMRRSTFGEDIGDVEDVDDVDDTELGEDIK